MKRGKKAVRITLEFRGGALCFDDAHDDFGPSALTEVGDLLSGMTMAILEHQMLATMSHIEEMAKIPKHHTKKRRDAETFHKKCMTIYDQQKATVKAAVKTARYDVVTNWNWDE